MQLMLKKYVVGKLMTLALLITEIFAAFTSIRPSCPSISVKVGKKRMNSLFGNEAHLIPPVVVGVVQLEQQPALQAVHDLHLTLHVPPAHHILIFTLIIIVTIITIVTIVIIVAYIIIVTILIIGTIILLITIIIILLIIILGTAIIVTFIVIVIIRIIVSPHSNDINCGIRKISPPSSHL